MSRADVVKHEMVEAPDNFWAIKLLESKFAGVIYRYGTIKFMGEDDEGNGIMSFEYDIIDPAGNSIEDLVGPEIDQIMGDILTKTIIESLEHKEKNGNDSDS